MPGGHFHSVMEFWLTSLRFVRSTGPWTLSPVLSRHAFLYTLEIPPRLCPRLSPLVTHGRGSIVRTLSSVFSCHVSAFVPPVRRLVAWFRSTPAPHGALFFCTLFSSRSVFQQILFVCSFVGPSAI